MPARHFPVLPNLDQLRNQAKDLLRAAREGEASATLDFEEFHPEKIHVADSKLADAQLVLARSYGIPSWPRLVVACKLTNAIWNDEIEEVRRLVLRQPELLHEQARGTASSNWGPPMSYAANLGRDRIIEMLSELGAKDYLFALERAALQGKIETARMLYVAAGRPQLPPNVLSGPAYTLNSAGTAVLFEMGARVYDDAGNRLAPVDTVLGTDSRKPAEKHRILEMYTEHGFRLPDTPTMALHRGRIDLLEEHLHRDPAMLRRTFTHEEIYPPEMGRMDDIEATQGTPLKGTTLLHLCADYDELEIAEWLIGKGMDVNVRAAVNADGFGGHTALFGTVVSQPAFWMNHLSLPPSAPFTKLLLDHGADPNIRASVRKKLHPGYGDDHLREYRDVTALSWGRRYHWKKFVSEPAMRLIEERGGRE